ncbi:MAG: rRNA maturation RNase YbeY [Microcystaceae cyanobacterium]
MVVAISPIQVELHLQIFFEQGDRLSDDLPTSAQWQSWTADWLNCLTDYLPPAAAYELTLRLTDDREIQQLNSQYRQQDQPTDVLAFAALEAELPDYQSLDPTEPLYLGDIVVSVATAYRQATQAEPPHSLTTELAWLACHGLLHLLGWDHPDEESLQAMVSQQAHLLNQVGLSTSFEF